MDNYIKGNFRKSLFNGDNGYVVGLFKVKDASDNNKEFLNKTVTFTGYFTELNENDTYLFNGEFVTHKKYGEQFSVSSFSVVLPEEKDSIVEFLASGLFKGIGEAKAKKIVDVLGKDTLNVIMTNPNSLLLVPSLTQKNINTLHDTLEEYQASYNTIVELNELGFVTKDSILIYNKYKSRTLDVIDENIYSLYEDIKDLTFKKIDNIARRGDYEIDDERRVKASILYVMEEVCNTCGHSYLDINEIYNYVNRCLTCVIDKDIFLDAMKKLTLDLKVIKESDRYYLKNMFEDEKLVASRISYLSKLKDNTYKNLASYINTYEEFLSIKYNDEQVKAITDALSKNFLVITGGPGTGKTTIVKAIVSLYQDIFDLSHKEMMDEVALLAPTGRAAKRLSETTLLPASTIHRFLKWNKDNDYFQVNEYQMSDVKFVIIDEASMIDINLMASLFRGLQSNTKIIMVGDYNQLPSVGPGQVLKDIIESEKVNVVKLKYLYRQASDSNIINLAYDINGGHISKDNFNIGNDLFFYEVDSSEIVNQIKKICQSYKHTDYKDFQILVPMYKTINGIDNINKMAQEIFNPKDSKKNEVSVGDVIYRVGDKILQLTNMPDENIYNGDIGIIKRIEKRDIFIDFDSNLVRFTPSNYINFTHGYAISIHKAQGSEFETVVIPVYMGYHKMLYRKLYYTGVTRAKKELYLVGSVKALEYAAITNDTDIRKTTLKTRIIESIGDSFEK